MDFKRLVVLLLPTALRQPLVFGILRAAAAGVEHVYRDFMAARRMHNFRLTHNGQVCHLRGMLNRCFGAGFKIGGVSREGGWLFAVTEDGENITLAVGEKLGDVPVLGSEQALNAAQNDFVVFVPGNCWNRLEEIKAMVDKYKLVTKRAHYVRAAYKAAGVRPWSPDVLTHLIISKNEYGKVH